MIRSFSDRNTRRFFEGRPSGGVSGLRGSGRAASHRVRPMRSPFGTWRGCPATAWKRYEANGPAGTASESMRSGGSVFVGERMDPAKWRSSIITEEVKAMSFKNGMRPVHPGEILRDELEALGLSANALSKALGVPVNRITAILNGQRGVTANTALRLARYFGTTPQLWLNLQKTWELRREEISRRPVDCRARPASTGGDDRREETRCPFLTIRRAPTKREQSHSRSAPCHRHLGQPLKLTRVVVRESLTRPHRPPVPRVRPPESPCRSCHGSAPGRRAMPR